MPKAGICCCGPKYDCDLRNQVRDDILAFPPTSFTADISGSANTYSRTNPKEWSYYACTPDINLGYAACANQNCCNDCHGVANCHSWECYLDEKLQGRTCANELAGVTTARLFHADHALSGCECSGGVGPCNAICQGFGGCSFGNAGMGAYAPPTFFSFSACAYTLACTNGFALLNTYDLASNETVTTVGSVTTRTYKRLRLHEWQRVVSGVTECHLFLALQFYVNCSEPWVNCFPGGNDGFFQNASWVRRWNGTSNAATFLASPLRLYCTTWYYDLCSPNHAPGNPWECVYYSNFVDTDCGKGDCPECTPATLNYTTQVFTPTFTQSAANCDTALATGLIDSTYQPWRSPSTTISIV